MSSTRRLEHSPFWTGVDGLLVTDMFAAAWDHLHGITRSGIATVQHWLDFIADPGLATFWLAHNASIFTAAFSARGRRWFSQEPHNEQRFINDALVLLGGSGTYEMMFPTDVETLACGPETPCIGLFAHAFYPPIPPRHPGSVARLVPA